MVCADWSGHLEAIRAGEQDALARLYDESSRLVFSLALRILGNSADAEEVTLDVYTQVWREARNFDAERGNAVTWLTMLARSRAIDRLRSRLARTGREEPMPEYAEFEDAAPRPDEAGEADQQRRRVAKALAMLPPEQRQVIELAYYSGLSQTELAARLGQPLGTVKTRVRLGMMKLRELLAADLAGPRQVIHGA